MPPARRLSRYKNSKHKTRRKIPWFYIGIVSLVILIVSLVIGFFIVKPKNFSSSSKLSLVVNGTEAVLVYVIDPKEPELTRIIIPSSTEIDSSRDLGKFRLGNIWKLGENESVGGKLLQESVVKNFGFPVSSWSDSEANLLFSGNLLQKASTVVSKFDSNLTLGDKFKIALFTLRNPKIKDIDLSETTFLRKTNFIGGEEGYQVTKTFPTNLILVFAKNEDAKKQLRVVLKNSSGMPASNLVPTVVEFSGAKVVSELKEKESDIFCEVVSEERDFAKKVADVFGCNPKVKEAEGNFDVEIRIGRNFLKSY